MSDATYVQKVAEKTTDQDARLVQETLDRATAAAESGKTFQDTTIPIEVDLIDRGADTPTTRLCLVAVHSCFEGWDSTIEFFLDREYDSVQEGQEALVDWVLQGNWL